MIADIAECYPIPIKPRGFFYYQPICNTNGNNSNNNNNKGGTFQVHYKMDTETGKIVLPHKDVA